jgi:hypothetical protein
MSVSRLNSLSDGFSAVFIPEHPGSESKQWNLIEWPILWGYLVYRGSTLGMSQPEQSKRGNERDHGDGFVLPEK